MNKKIKIGDIVVYSPSLSPIIGRVNGIAGEHLLIRTEDNTRLECTTKECCPITEEELERLKQIRKGNSD